MLLLASNALASERDDDGRLIVVTVANASMAAMRAGSTPRAYGALPAYQASTAARKTVAALASDYHMRAIKAWPIAMLRVHCVVFEIPADRSRSELLERLKLDKRVTLAQPMNIFRTLSEHYNDPYVGLQRGFDAIDAASAQRWSQGKGVDVAVIDTAVDASHPDLRDRVTEQRDFASSASPSTAPDRHGTEVAGVIAAVANNELGIVGVAPAANLRTYRACWTVDASGKARCDSYTLALALGAAIDAGADIVNLSFGGPSDPLLAELTTHAIEHGAVVVGAVPPDGRMDGFPVGVPGVIAVRALDDAPAPAAIGAPGRDILTLEPGGRYDFASGSSLAAADVSGALALLLELRPRLRGTELFALLRDAQRDPDASIDICHAMNAVKRNTACRTQDPRPLASTRGP
jgi:hypothetical protein